MHKSTISLFSKDIIDSNLCKWDSVQVSMFHDNEFHANLLKSYLMIKVSYKAILEFLNIFVHCVIKKIPSAFQGLIQNCVKWVSTLGNLEMIERKSSPIYRVASLKEGGGSQFL